MKHLHVRAVWESEHDVEVPDDFQVVPGGLDDDVVDQIDPRHAELVDWTVA